MVGEIASTRNNSLMVSDDGEVREAPSCAGTSFSFADHADEGQERARGRTGETATQGDFKLFYLGARVSSDMAKFLRSRRILALA